GLALGLDVAGDLHPLAVREQFEQAWLAFVDGVAGRGPLVIAVEDIHWAQDALLDFVARLVAETNAPLLVLATARPELFGARPAWGRGAQASTLWLEPLSRPDAATLIQSRSRRFSTAPRATRSSSKSSPRSTGSRRRSPTPCRPCSPAASISC